MQRYFFRVASGSTRYGLTIRSIEYAFFVKPHTIEQLEIKNRIYAIDDKLKKEQKALSKYQQIKKGLMQDLLTGKVEVKIAEEMITE